MEFNDFIFPAPKPSYTNKLSGLYFIDTNVLTRSQSNYTTMKEVQKGIVKVSLNEQEKPLQKKIEQQLYYNWKNSFVMEQYYFFMEMLKILECVNPLHMQQVQNLRWLHYAWNILVMVQMMENVVAIL